MTVEAKPAAQGVPINPLAYSLVYLATGLPMYLGGGLRVEGQEHVPKTGRVVVAGNHRTALDPFVIAHALGGRRIHFMAKKELFEGRMTQIGKLILAGGSFPVDRDRNDLQAIRTSLRVLQGEGMLGIFPEGTRGGGELQGGAALLALKGKAPILPVFVTHHKRPWPGKWTVRFGPSFPAEGGVKDLTEKIGAAIQALRD